MLSLGATMTRFFITHSWADIGFTRKLYNDLIANGLDGFFDERSVPAGGDIPSYIEEGLENCDVYIPVFSSEALKSKWCDWEINIAITMNRENGRPHIIPIIAKKCTIPARLRPLLYVNFEGRYDDALKDLLIKGFGISPTKTIPSQSYTPPTNQSFQLPQSRKNIAATITILLFAVMAICTMAILIVFEPTRTSLLSQITRSSTPIVNITATRPSSIPTPWILNNANTLAYPDPTNLCSITPINAAIIERPNAIKITFDTSVKGSWCIWEVRLQNFDASQKTALSFQIRGEKGGEQFGIGIKDFTTLPGGEPKVKKTASPLWQNILVSLQELQNTKQQNLFALENLSFSFTSEWGSGTIYVDEFAFVP
jgi:hypothetical protein